MLRFVVCGNDIMAVWVSARPKFCLASLAKRIDFVLAKCNIV